MTHDMLRRAGIVIGIVVLASAFLYGMVTLVEKTNERNEKQLAAVLGAWRHKSEPIRMVVAEDKTVFFLDENDNVTHTYRLERKDARWVLKGCKGSHSHYIHLVLSDVGEEIVVGTFYECKKGCDNVKGLYQRALDMSLPIDLGDYE